MPDLPNFGQMTNLKYNLSRGIKFLTDVINRSRDAIIFISKSLYFKDTWSNQFYQHHQNQVKKNI